MSFLDFVGKNNKSLRIYNNIYLREGESINIYGAQYVGKTSFCFYIIKNNSNKKIVYFASEILDKLYKKKLETIQENIYLVNNTNIKDTIDIINEINPELIIIDSLTAMQYISEKNNLSRLFNLVDEKRMNLVLVSQIRNYEGKEYYEHKKILDYFAYKINIETDGKHMILNKEYKIKYNEIWNERRWNYGKEA